MAFEVLRVLYQGACAGAKGAVVLLEKLSPALAHADSSSGALGSAV